MLTRGGVCHTINPVAPKQLVRPGFARVEVVNGIPQTWPVMRPGSSPDGNSHLWNATPRNFLLRGGAAQLTPSVPNLAMDPTDRSTWQRNYRFSS